MGMYSFEIVPVQNLASTYAYDISVIASADGSITTNEVLQFTLNDTFTNVILTAPEKTKVNYEKNVVTWEIGSLDVATKDIPLVLKVSAEHSTELQEGALVASAITNTFLNEEGEEIEETLEDFSFDPLTSPSFDLKINVTPLENCQYRLDFKATNNSSVRIDNITINYLLDAANFIWVTPPPAPSTITQWPVGTLLTSGPDKDKEQSAVIQFIGTTTGVKTIFANITASPAAAFTGIRSLATNVTKVCPQTPCCEKCPTAVPVDFDACEQSESATVTAEIDSDGREIKVKIRLTNVCKNKKVVVGLELFEGRISDPNPVRKVLKVIQLTRTTGDNGCAPFECDCATFFIPGPICPEQHFFIKAQAHYFDATPSTCKCTCPTNGVLE